MHIREAGIIDIPEIHKIAHLTWWPTYESFLSEEQISFMLNDMYSTEAIEQQMKEGTSFILAIRNNECVAFAAFLKSNENKQILRIQKLYILPSEQGKGIGKLLIDHMEICGRKMGCSIMELNVNRSNPAKAFYEKNGFKIFQIIDIPYHQFTMDDYIMRKQLA